MKINKKVLIPLFATAMGLSVVGGISGAVAWYQYNSRVSASFIGTSVADTGVLQIGHLELVYDQNGDPVDADNNGAQDEKMVWGRDFSADVNASHLIPVTFGKMGTQEELLVDENGDPLDEDNDGQQDKKVHKNILPAKAYAYPESGAGEGYVNRGDAINDPYFPHWVEAKSSDYAQFDLYFRALRPLTANGTEIEDGFELAEREVFLSDYILESIEADKDVKDALRIHLDIENQENLLLADIEHKDDLTTANVNEALPLFGNLDLDKNGKVDTYHNSAFYDMSVYDVDNNGDPVHHAGEDIVYGQQNEYQETATLASLKETRGENGSMPANSEKGLFKTSKDGNVKVTVTIWLEGWEMLTKHVETEVINEGQPDEETITTVTKGLEWNPKYTAGTDIQLGLQFDTGIFRGTDL